MACILSYKSSMTKYLCDSVEVICFFQLNPNIDKYDTIIIPLSIKKEYIADDPKSQLISSNKKNHTYLQLEDIIHFHKYKHYYDYTENNEQYSCYIKKELY